MSHNESMQAGRSRRTFANVPAVAAFIESVAVNKSEITSWLAEDLKDAAYHLDEHCKKEARFVQGTKDEMCKMHQQIHDLTGDLQAARDLCETLATSPNELAIKVQAREDTIDQLREELLQANEEIGRLRNLAQPVDYRIQQLQNQLTSAGAHIQVIEANNADLAARVREFNDHKPSALAAGLAIAERELDESVIYECAERRGSWQDDLRHVYKRGLWDGLGETMGIKNGAKQLSKSITIEDDGTVTMNHEDLPPEHAHANVVEKTPEKLAESVHSAAHTARPTQALNDIDERSVQSAERTIAQIIRSSHNMFDAGNHNGHASAADLAAANVMRYLTSIASIIQNAPKS